MNLPNKVRLVEVGPRDGLQNERAIVPVDIKVALVDRLTEAGFSDIEVTSFVSPKWVPQMADNAEVMAKIQRRPAVTYSALVPNMRGFESAHTAGVDEIVIFTAASEAFAQKNINCSIAESIARFAPVLQAAKTQGIKVRGSISCSLGCPYQGEVPITAVADVVQRLKDLGVDEIDVADTIGIGTPGRVSAVMESAAKIFPVDRLAGHFHDTYGMAIANIVASMQVGISSFHSSVSGLGGCPYAKGATGNVASEDVLYLMQGLGIETGVNMDKLRAAGKFISDHLGREPVSRVARALAAKDPA